MLRERWPPSRRITPNRDSLGWALFRLGRNDEAITELRRAAVAKEPDGVVFDHLGDVLGKLGRHDEALKSWRQAVAALGKPPDSAKRRAVQAKIDVPHPVPPTKSPSP